jgi:glutathione S-transferase
VQLLGDELSMAAASLLCGFLERLFLSKDPRQFCFGDELSMAAASLLCGFLKRLLLGKDPRQFCWPWF